METQTVSADVKAAVDRATVRIVDLIAELEKRVNEERTLDDAQDDRFDTYVNVLSDAQDTLNEFKEPYVWAADAASRQYRGRIDAETALNHTLKRVGTTLEAAWDVLRRAPETKAEDENELGGNISALHEAVGLLTGFIRNGREADDPDDGEPQGDDGPGTVESGTAAVETVARLGVIAKALSEVVAELQAAEAGNTGGEERKEAIRKAARKAAAALRNAGGTNAGESGGTEAADRMDDLEERVTRLEENRAAEKPNAEEAEGPGCAGGGDAAASTAEAVKLIEQAMVKIEIGLKCLGPRE